MIRVVDRYNRHLHEDLLEQQFRLRHEVFVKEKGWTNLEREKVYEKDEYDNDEAIYMIAVDEDSEQVIGGYRLYPTMLPHMITETFPHLVAGAIPQRADVMELTRFTLHRDHRRGRYYYEVLASFVEYGLLAGIPFYSSIIRTLRMPIIQAAGVGVTPLGLPMDIGGESCVAVKLEVSETNLIRTLRSGNLSGSVIASGTTIRKVA